MLKDLVRIGILDDLPGLISYVRKRLAPNSDF